MTKKKVSCPAGLCVILCTTLFSFYISSCSFRPLSRAASAVINDSSLRTAHVGISVYEPASGKYWYNYNGDKYFVPASNTKLPTCYAAMKYLADSLVGLRWQSVSDTAIQVMTTGDPVFLHPDFKQQPVLDFLKKEKKPIYFTANWKDDALGSGWTWNDYLADYMAERSAFPLAGNLAHIHLDSYNYQLLQNGRHAAILSWSVKPRFFKNYLDSLYILPPAIAAQRDMADTAAEKKALLQFAITRPMDSNYFSLEPSTSKFIQTDIPYHTDGLITALQVLEQDYGMSNIRLGKAADISLYGDIQLHQQWHTIYSQPTDSLLKPMMHRSDNFFAEQSLMMVSNERLGVMSNERIIDTLLKTDLKDLPQKPRWVDGSGLSRYNLFSPQDFVAILGKIKKEFGMARIQQILPTGGEGTLTNYYIADKGYIFAKTGSLSGVLCLSGYLYTKKNKLLIFSILVNNHQAVPSAIRRVVEKFIQSIRDKY